MKQLIVSLSVMMVTISVFAKLPKAEDKTENTICTNSFEYSRRGSLGAMDWVVTEIPTTNLVTKGVNSWLDTDEYPGGVDAIYGFGVSYKTDGGITITDPQSGDQVASSYYFTDNGHSFVGTEQEQVTSEKFSYFSQGRNRISTNMGYCYGTNSLNTASTVQIYYPDSTASGDDTILTHQNGSGITNGVIHCDRTWVIRILKAYRDNKLTINDDGSIIIND